MSQKPENFSAPGQNPDPPGNEHEMEPRPDYGRDSYKGSGKLKGKIALVTGADSGIGRAIAVAFAREGANVACSYWNEHKDAEETKKVIEESGQEAILLPGDLTQEAQCKKIVEETVSKWGRIDVLVNNAAFQGKLVEKFEDIERSRLERTFHTNILAYFSIAQAAAKHMPKGSAIINVASVQAYQPEPGILDYASTKGAIVTFTKGLSSHLISRGIRVNAIAPGPVWTPLVVASFPDSMTKSFGTDMTPIARPAQPAEYGPPAVFLATNDSSYVVGAILSVTGGMLIN